ncbi:MAG: class I SAM-dependent methyltransferase [Candidatus Firestonebacteria bacterium]
MKKILDLGCGNNKMEGALGLDKQKYPCVDLVYDLDKMPYPFKDNEFDFVNCSHIIEHVAEPYEFVKEICRISRPDAELRIITPHYTSQLSYSDLTHKYHFGYNTFVWLEQRGIVEIINHKIYFTDLYNIALIGFFANLFPRRWEKYLAFIFPALYVEVLLKVKKNI